MAASPETTTTQYAPEEQALVMPFEQILMRKNDGMDVRVFMRTIAALPDFILAVDDTKKKDSYKAPVPPEKAFHAFHHPDGYKPQENDDGAAFAETQVLLYEDE